MASFGGFLAEHTKNHADGSPNGGPFTTNPKPTTPRDSYEREVKELRRANEILKSAAHFFGAELDRQSKK